MYNILYKNLIFGGKWILYYTNMVIVAEMVKHLIVVQAIVGSIPTLHTNYPYGGIGIRSGFRPHTIEGSSPSMGTRIK